MANSFYYTDGAASDHTLYVGDGTDTIYFVIAKSEYGDDETAIEMASELTPNRYADQYRGVHYKPREYGFRMYTKRDTAANLESSLSTLRGYFNRELGEGHIKRVTPGAVTRELDCVLKSFKHVTNHEYNGPAGQVTDIGFTAHNPWWRSETAGTATDTLTEAITVANGTLEAGGTGGNFNGGAEVDDGTSDTFTSWTNAGVNDGTGDKVEATATKHGGSYAVKMTYTTGQVDMYSANITAIPGEGMTLKFWTRGDATVGGYYRVYDVTHTAEIVGSTATGVTAATYAQVSKTFTVPAGCVNIRIYLYGSSAAGVAYFDDVTLARTTILIACANGGQIDSWPVITFTGIVNTPVVTNSDGDAITVNYTTVNADDTLTIDCRPNGTYRRSVYYREHATGTVTYKTISSASKYPCLPTGTNNLSVTQTGTAEVTVLVSWYLYYGGLY